MYVCMYIYIICNDKYLECEKNVSNIWGFTIRVCLCGFTAEGVRSFRDCIDRLVPDMSGG